MPDKEIYPGLESRAQSATSSALKKLVGLQPSTVMLVTRDGQVETLIAEIKQGDKKTCL